MAGGAGTYAVDGVSYSTVAAAITQLIADEDGTATTATQNIVLSINTSESNVTLPTSAQVNSGRTYPIVIKSANAGSPQTITSNTGATFLRAQPSAFIIIQDLAITNTNGACISYTGNNSGSRPLTIKDCTLTASAQAIFTRYFGSIYVDGCSIESTGSNLFDTSASAFGEFVFTNCSCRSSGEFANLQALGMLLVHRCGIRCENASAVINSDSERMSIHISDSTIYATNTPVLVDMDGVTTTASVFFPTIRNSIIDGVNGYFKATNGYPQYYDMNVYGNNIWSNYGGGTFIDVSDSNDDVATLAAYQALGYETGSASENITFASTTLGNANFLKLSGNTSNQVNNSGWYEDAFSTKRESYDSIDAGWHQFTEQIAPTTPTFSGITALSDGGDGTLIAQWDAATDVTHYEVSIHTSSMNSGDLNARTYLVGAVDDDGSGSYSYVLCREAGGDTALTAGTTYYVAVLARNGATGDGGSTNLSATVTNPNPSAGPAVVIPDPTPVQLGVTATTVYTVPANKRAVITTITAQNTDSSARTVNLYKVQSGDTAADDTAFYKSYPLAAAGSVSDRLNDNEQYTLTAGTTIQGISDVAAKVTVTIGVIEVTP